MRSDLKIRTTVNSTASALSGEGLENVASPCSGSNGSSCFKENININKSEMPTLSLEPLQMKRKKKGGEYNLRKSLAWNRAFFTEEGVLDPLELSVISGASCREGLPFISEDTSGGSLLPLKPVNLQNLEFNLVKERQDEDLVKDMKKDSSASKISRRVPTRGGSKSGSRGGDCPRPTFSSSLKRPAVVNVAKAAGKDLKLPKVPGSKTSISPICATTRSTILRANCVKHNQITQPDLNIQRDAGLTSSSKSLRNTQNESKTSSLRSAHYSDGDSISQGTSSSSINMSRLLVKKAGNSGAKMISGNITPAKAVNSSEGQHESAAFATPFTRNAHVSGRTIPSQNQIMKPSGLRMPSPSLSFFSQPQPSVFRDLSLRDAETDVCGSQKPGDPRLQDSLRRTLKMDNQMPESIISSTSKAMSSTPECMSSSHVSAVDIIKPDLEQNPVQKVGSKNLNDVLNPESVSDKLFESNSCAFDGQLLDLPKKTRMGRTSQEEAKLQKADIEAPSRSGRPEQTTDDHFCKQAIDDYPVKSESCGSGWRNPEIRFEQSHAVQVSEALSAIDEPPKEKSTCNSLVLNHGAISGTGDEDAVDHKSQNHFKIQRDWEETCEVDHNEPHRKQTDPFKYSIGETDKRTAEDKNLLNTTERASEKLGVSKLNESWHSGSPTTEPSEKRGAVAGSTYFASKHPEEDLLKEAAFLGVLTDNSHEGEAHMQSKVDLTSEIGDNHCEKVSVVQHIFLNIETESQGNIALNTTDGLLPEEQIFPQNSQQVENMEIPGRKDGNKVIDTKMRSSMSPSDFDKDKLISQPLAITGFDIIDKSLSSESPDNLINSISSHEGKHNGSTNGLLSGAANKNLSNSLQHDTLGMEIDYCNLFSESRTYEVSQKNTFRKVKEVGPVVQDCSADNWLTSSLSVKEAEPDMDRNTRDSGTVLVHSSERSLPTKCFSNHSEHLVVPSEGFVAENLVKGDYSHFKHHLQTKSPVDVIYEDNALRSTEDSVTGQSEIDLSILRSSSISAKESPVEHETCNDVYGTEGLMSGAKVEPLRTNPFPDTSKSEVSEDTNSSSSCPDSKLENVKVEAALEPNNKLADGLNKSSRLFIPPQNAIPFSDEWLAAIEAAGEDILTMKSGAVQNSPTDKSQPEPSPWSPVRKKNNQIGPFDCTKFTNVDPSDSG